MRKGNSKKVVPRPRPTVQPAAKPDPHRAASWLAAWRQIPAWVLAAVLALVTMALYWPAVRCGFVNFDDDLYVTSNHWVLAGLTQNNAAWAFTTDQASNWHPLTWLSLMLDVSLFGTKAAGFHFTNVALHALNAVLLFALLRRLTGALWRSVLVAALFALHPLTVESVAWVSERKNVLSFAFGLLTLLCYVNYARGTGARSQKSEARTTNGNSGDPVPHSSFSYWLALFCFTVGLLGKQILVPWPFGLLLLDFWPLGRWQPGKFWSLVVEKIPFFLLSLAACVVTFVAEKRGGSVVVLDHLPFDERFGNAVVSFGRYLEKLFWPLDLAVFYPYAGRWPAGMVVLALVCLGGVSVVLFLGRRRQPFLLMGWLWYCGTLMPVIGLVQIGSQAIADRHMYIPSVGVLIMAIWGAHEWAGHWHCRRLVCSLAGAVALIFCLVLTRRQISCWQSTETLFTHDLEVTQKNFLADNNLGEILLDRGEPDAAISRFQESVRFQPSFLAARNNLGIALFQKGEVAAAISQFREALRRSPQFADAHNDLPSDTIVTTAFHAPPRLSCSAVPC